MNNCTKKLLRAGIIDFKRIKGDDDLYVDKTLFIQEDEEVTHIALTPRPRCFGKILNFSILRYFFEKIVEERNYLFEESLIDKLKTTEYASVYLKTCLEENFERKDMSIFQLALHRRDFIKQSVLYRNRRLS